MRAMGCVEGGPMTPDGGVPMCAGMGEYFSGVGADAVVPTTGTIAETPNSWKGPWFIGLFVGMVIGISIGKLTK